MSKHRKVRKSLKIAGITLASLLGVVLLAVVLLVYVVFTPSRLTPIVKKVADQYINCEYRIGAVDLTFFSSFPEFALRADGLLLVNPTEGAQSDTLLEADKVVARIDLMRLLRAGNLTIREVAMQGLQLNAFIGQTGQTNFDVLSLPADTTEKDTTSSEPFIKSVTMDNLNLLLEARQITLLDLRDSIQASLHQSDIMLTAQAGSDSTEIVGRLKATLPAISACLKGETYASDADIRVNLPFRMHYRMPALMDITQLHLAFEDASLSVNRLKAQLTGEATILPDIDMDIRLQTNKWRISELLAVVPKFIFTMPKGIEADGDMQLDGHIAGAYNDSILPLIDANILLSDASGATESLPYTLEKVEGNIDLHLDLNQEPNSRAVIHSFQADTKQSSFTATGEVTDLLNSMLLNIRLGLDIHLPDAAYFLPKNMTADGRAKGSIDARITLDNLSNLLLDKGKITADLTFSNLKATMDSMVIRTKKADLAFHIPNSRKATDKTGKERLRKMAFLDGTLGLSDLHVKEDGSMDISLGKTQLNLQVNDILNHSDIIFAKVGLKTHQLDGEIRMDATTAAIKAEQPDVNAYVEYNTVDTTRIPVLDAQFAFADLKADYDTIHAHLSSPSGTASLAGGTMEKARLAAKIQAADLSATMGRWLRAQTGKIHLSASGKHTSNKENILLEWQPKLAVQLTQGKAVLDGLEPEIRIPEIQFNYSNRDFRIDTSRIELGHSNFSLSGEIRNIGRWMRKTEMMTGELNFRSSQTNIDELLAYISNMGGDDDDASSATATTATAAATATTAGETESTATAEQQASETTSQEGDPFLVPKRTDIVLHTRMDNATAFGQRLYDLGGDIFIRDGVMVVKEVGFICNAAKLQLSAMYKTPRRNHVFVGLDYHMTDVDIHQLVNMIPPVQQYVPMLSAFSGNADFHLAAETYCDSRYNIKPSTTRAACSISGKNLEIADNSTFQKIAKILSFNRTSDFRIDSISTEINMYKNDIEIYPLLVTFRKWKAAIGGQHYVDNTQDLSHVQMSANYHVSLLSPLYLGVDITGPMDNLKIKPAKCRYAKDFLPARHEEAETESANIRAMIRKALEQEMKK